MPESAGVSSRAEVHMQRSESTTVDQLMKMTNLYEAQLAGGGGHTNLLPENISSDSRQVSLEREAAFGLEPLSVSTPMARKEGEKDQGGDEDKPSLRDREPSVVDLYLPVPVSALSAASVNGSSSSGTSKAKKIEMGQIGTVTLLESIKEADADEELSYTSTELSSEREEEPKMSRLGQLARDSVDDLSEGRPREDSEETGTETGTGTEEASTARVSSAERRSILVRREAATRTPSPAKERRSVKYDESSLKKEAVTSDLTQTPSHSDSRTASSPESPQRKPPAQQQTQKQQQQQQQQQAQKQQQQQAQTQQQQKAQQQQQQSSCESASGSPDSKLSRGWESPVKQQASPSTRTSEPLSFPKEPNFPLDAVLLGKKASQAEHASRDVAGPQTSARGSGDSRSPEPGRRGEERRKVLSPGGSGVQGGRSPGRTSSASTVTGSRLDVEAASTNPTPRLSPRASHKAKKGKTQGPKYEKFVRRYEKDLPPYLKNRLLTAGTS